MPNAWNGADPTEAADAADYELGVEYLANSAITITHVRVWSGAGEVDIANRRARVWTPLGVQLGIATLPANLPVGWSSYALDAPVVRQAGERFIISYSSGGNYGALANGLSASVPSADGVVTALSFDASTAGNGRFNTTPTLFPTTGSTTSAFYGPDFTYTVGAAGSTATLTFDANEIPEDKLPGAPAVEVEATPFAVYAVEECLLGLSAQERNERARQRLALIEQGVVEEVFWTGRLGNTPALATGAPFLVADPDTPVDLVTGVSLLEQWLGRNSGATGFLHVNRGAAAVAAEHQQTVRAGNQLQTHLGNTWVFGGGYPTSGPTGQPAPTGREVWMFATRQVTVRRTEVAIPEEPIVDWRKNRAMVLAERVYVVDYPCQAAAVLVDLSLCPCIAGGA